MVLYPVNEILKSINDLKAILICYKNLNSIMCLYI